MNVRRYVVAIIIALFATPFGFAEDSSPTEVPAFSQQELDQMLAPIALYPDALLSQILMASTYPLEIVEAARWSRANPGMKGEQAVRAAEARNWDPSVKSLVAFPQLITMMDEKLEWTQRLGDAFLAQPSQMMDSVQQLRRRAYAAGTLRSTDEYRVEQRDRIIVVTSPRPDVVYVPYYDPYVVYAGWHWSAHPPVYWAPWSGYVHRAGFVGFRWSFGIHVGHGFFFGAFDWPHRHVKVVNVNTFYYPRVVHHTAVHHHVWNHDPLHRRGVHYKHPQVRQEYVRVNAPQVRREYPQHTGPSHEVRRDWSPHRVQNNQQNIHKQDQRRDERNGKHDSQRRDAAVKQLHDRGKRPDPVQRAAPDQRLPVVKVNEQKNVRTESQTHTRTPLESRAPIEPRHSTQFESRASQRSGGDHQPDARQHQPRDGMRVPGDDRQHQGRGDGRYGGGTVTPSRGYGAFQAGVQGSGTVRRN